MSTPLILADGSSYPLLNVFWTMLEFFIWILWFFLIFRIITDIFRSPDLSGGARAAWVILVILLPFLGVLFYLIFRGSGMHERDVRRAEQNNAALTDYIRQTAGTTPSTSEELSKLATLRDQGVLTEEEFQAQKAKILA
jgi:hypothetical protein